MNDDEDNFVEVRAGTRTVRKNLPEPIHIEFGATEVMDVEEDDARIILGRVDDFDVGDIVGLYILR